MKYLILIGGLLLAACTQSKRTSHVEVLWHNGDCLLVADGLTAEQVKEVNRSWNFEDCKVTFEE